MTDVTTLYQPFVSFSSFVVLFYFTVIIIIIIYVFKRNINVLK